MTEHIVRQLTIGEIQDLIEDEEKATESPDWKPDIIEMLFPGRFPVKGILLSSGLTREDLKRMSQDDMDALFAKVEAKNPFFAQMMARLGTLLQDLKT